MADCSFQKQQSTTTIPLSEGPWVASQAALEGLPESENGRSPMAATDNPNHHRPPRLPPVTWLSKRSPPAPPPPTLVDFGNAITDISGILKRVQEAVRQRSQALVATVDAEPSDDSKDFSLHAGHFVASLWAEEFKLGLTGTPVFGLLQTATAQVHARLLERLLVLLKQLPPRLSEGDNGGPLDRHEPPDWGPLLVMLWSLTELYAAVCTAVSDETHTSLDAHNILKGTQDVLCSLNECLLAASSTSVLMGLRDATGEVPSGLFCLLPTVSLVVSNHSLQWDPVIMLPQPSALLPPTEDCLDALCTQWLQEMLPLFRDGPTSRNAERQPSVVSEKYPVHIGGVRAEVQLQLSLPDLGAPPIVRVADHDPGLLVRHQLQWALCPDVASHEPVNPIPRVLELVPLLRKPRRSVLQPETPSIPTGGVKEMYDVTLGQCLAEIVSVLSSRLNELPTTDGDPMLLSDSLVAVFALSQLVRGVGALQGRLDNTLHKPPPLALAEPSATSAADMLGRDNDDLIAVKVSFRLQVWETRTQLISKIRYLSFLSILLIFVGLLAAILLLASVDVVQLTAVDILRDAQLEWMYHSQPFDRVSPRPLEPPFADKAGSIAGVLWKGAQRLSSLKFLWARLVDFGPSPNHNSFASLHVIGTTPPSICSGIEDLYLGKPSLSPTPIPVSFATFATLLASCEAARIEELAIVTQPPSGVYSLWDVVRINSTAISVASSFNLEMEQLFDCVVLATTSCLNLVLDETDLNVLLHWVHRGGSFHAVSKLRVRPLAAFLLGSGRVAFDLPPSVQSQLYHERGGRPGTPTRDAYLRYVEWRLRAELACVFKHLVMESNVHPSSLAVRLDVHLLDTAMDRASEVLGTIIAKQHGLTFNGGPLVLPDVSEDEDASSPKRNELLLSCYGLVIDGEGVVYFSTRIANRALVAGRLPIPELFGVPIPFAESVLEFYSLSVEDFGGIIQYIAQTFFAQPSQDFNDVSIQFVAQSSQTGPLKQYIAPSNLTKQLRRCMARYLSPSACFEPRNNGVIPSITGANNNTTRGNDLYSPLREGVCVAGSVHAIEARRSRVSSTVIEHLKHKIHALNAQQREVVARKSSGNTVASRALAEALDRDIITSSDTHNPSQTLLTVFHARRRHILSSCPGELCAISSFIFANPAHNYSASHRNDAPPYVMHLDEVDFSASPHGHVAKEGGAGNFSFPPEARAASLYGSLMLSIAWAAIIHADSLPTYLGFVVGFVNVNLLVLAVWVLWWSCLGFVVAAWLVAFNQRAAQFKAQRVASQESAKRCAIVSTAVAAIGRDACQAHNARRYLGGGGSWMLIAREALDISLCCFSPLAALPEGVSWSPVDAAFRVGRQLMREVAVLRDQMTEASYRLICAVDRYFLAHYGDARQPAPRAASGFLARIFGATEEVSPRRSTEEERCRYLNERSLASSSGLFATIIACRLGHNGLSDHTLAAIEVPLRSLSLASSCQRITASTWAGTGIVDAFDSLDIWSRHVIDQCIREITAAGVNATVSCSDVLDVFAEWSKGLGCLEADELDTIHGQGVLRLFLQCPILVADANDSDQCGFGGGGSHNEVAQSTAYLTLLHAAVSALQVLTDGIEEWVVLPVGNGSRVDRSHCQPRHLGVLLQCIRDLDLLVRPCTNVPQPSPDSSMRGHSNSHLSSHPGGAAPFDAIRIFYPFSPNAATVTSSAATHLLRLEYPTVKDLGQEGEALREIDRFVEKAKVALHYYLCALRALRAGIEWDTMPTGTPSPFLSEDDDFEMLCFSGLLGTGETSPSMPNQSTQSFSSTSSASTRVAIKRTIIRTCVVGGTPFDSLATTSRPSPPRRRYKSPVDVVDAAIADLKALLAVCEAYAVRHTTRMRVVSMSKWTSDASDLSPMLPLTGVQSPRRLSRGASFTKLPCISHSRDLSPEPTPTTAAVAVSSVPPDGGLIPDASNDDCSGTSPLDGAVLARAISASTVLFDSQIPNVHAIEPTLLAIETASTPHPFSIPIITPPASPPSTVPESGTPVSSAIVVYAPSPPSTSPTSTPPPNAAPSPSSTMTTMDPTTATDDSGGKAVTTEANHVSDSSANLIGTSSTLPTSVTDATRFRSMLTDPDEGAASSSILPFTQSDPQTSASSGSVATHRKPKAAKTKAGRKKRGASNSSSHNARLPQQMIASGNAVR